LAKKLGVTPQHISIIEQDKRTPSLVFLAKLAEELGVSTDYLITGKESATGVISAIKADKSLTLKNKKLLIALVAELSAKSVPEK
jgi:transcriptional regulator with XRE-family HTH domain